MRKAAFVLVLAVIGAAISLGASDRVGVYAVIDRVVLEPSATNPDRIQIWGAFALAKPLARDGSEYGPVQRGYLYFKAGSQKELSSKEWNDLKTLAGTKRIVAFGARYGMSVQVRAESETPRAPDTYVTGVGVETVRPGTEYAPIKALTAYINR
jgi:hypothetical protein